MTRKRLKGHYIYHKYEITILNEFSSKFDHIYKTYIHLINASVYEISDLSLCIQRAYYASLNIHKIYLELYNLGVNDNALNEQIFFINDAMLNIRKYVTELSEELNFHPHDQETILYLEKLLSYRSIPEFGPLH